MISWCVPIYRFKNIDNKNILQYNICINEFVRGVPETLLIKS